MDFIERFNFSLSEKGTPSCAEKFSGKESSEYYYATLCLYCAENDIDLSIVTAQDFDAGAETIKDFGNGEIDDFYFWID